MADFVESTTLLNIPELGYVPVEDVQAVPAARQVSEISVLLHSLDEAAAETGHSVAAKRGGTRETQLVQARLGMASGLYTALCAKHPQSASHSLRVALGCSSWAAILQLDDETRDLLEVAALLHDVGKIGVPEKVLLKPGRLTPEEVALMGAPRGPDDGSAGQ